MPVTKNMTNSKLGALKDAKIYVEFWLSTIYKHFWQKSDMTENR